MRLAVGTHQRCQCGGGPGSWATDHATAFNLREYTHDRVPAQACTGPRSSAGECEPVMVSFLFCTVHSFAALPCALAAMHLRSSHENPRADRVYRYSFRFVRC